MGNVYYRLIEEGTESLIPSHQRYDIGIYPRRYWVYETSDEPFEAEPVRAVPLQQVVKVCARCKRPMSKPQYTYCYRCHMYLQKKVGIA